MFCAPFYVRSAMSKSRVFYVKIFKYLYSEGSAIIGTVISNCNIGG